MSDSFEQDTSRFSALDDDEKAIMQGFEAEKIDLQEVIDMMDFWAEECTVVKGAAQGKLHAKLLQCASVYEKIPPYLFTPSSLLTGSEDVLITATTKYAEFISDLALVAFLPVNALPTFPFFGPLMEQKCALGGRYKDKCLAPFAKDCTIRFPDKLTLDSVSCSATSEPLTKTIFLNRTITNDDIQLRDIYSVTFDLISQLSFMECFYTADEEMLNRSEVKATMFLSGISFALDTFKNYIVSHVNVKHFIVEKVKEGMVIVPNGELGVELANLGHYLFEVLVRGTIKNLRDLKLRDTELRLEKLIRAADVLVHPDNEMVTIGHI